MGDLIFITGGARSGKSTFAEKMAQQLGGPVTYIATAYPSDGEMQDRIKKHRQQRPQHWSTVEEPLHVSRVIKKVGDRPGIILLDCLTVLVTNMLFLEEEFPQDDDYNFDVKEEVLQAIEEEVEKMVLAAKECLASVIVVSNEVGMGLVPPYRLGRLYRDTIGRANQRVAAHADQVFFVVAGLPMRLK